MCLNFVNNSSRGMKWSLFFPIRDLCTPFPYCIHGLDFLRLKLKNLKIRLHVDSKACQALAFSARKVVACILPVS